MVTAGVFERSFPAKRQRQVVKDTYVVAFLFFLLAEAKNVVSVGLNDVENLTLCNLDRWRRMIRIVGILDIVVDFSAETVINRQIDLGR